jgi:hypothetical protein
MKEGLEDYLGIRVCLCVFVCVCIPQPQKHFQTPAPICMEISVYITSPEAISVAYIINSSISNTNTESLLIVTCIARQRRDKRLAEGHARIGRMFISRC